MGEYWLEKRATSQALKDLLRREAGAREVAGLLTHREQEVLSLLCRGLRNRQIAEELTISEPTVKVHLQHIYEKLHVRGRLALLRYAEDKGLV
jgi:DNA-binding NarL/FixJ family response regulator